jgi:hypothetical protein
MAQNTPKSAKIEITGKEPTMRRDTELESLAMRLANRADSPLLRDQPEMQSDMRAAADVVRHYITVLRATGKGASGRELAELLCQDGRPAGTAAWHTPPASPAGLTRSVSSQEDGLPGQARQ